MRTVEQLERADIPWCAIGGIAVNHWAVEAMVTQDLEIVFVADAVNHTVQMLEAIGFTSERFAWSINFRGRSKVRIQLSTEEFYHEFRREQSRLKCTGF